jgi:SAM-dependent methyltransferase
MSLSRHKKVWDDLGREDPLWAILTDPARRGGRWDLEEFFATGRHDIAQALAVGEELGLPRARGSALDFGCGVGRLTRALADHFERCSGVDVSTPMIEQARELNRDLEPRCSFHVNATEDLRLFPDDSFDFVYSRLVLQHMPRQSTIRSYLREFARILRPGGLLAFQLPGEIGLRQRIQSHRRVYGLLRWLGFSSDYLLNRLKLSPMALTPLPEGQVREALRAGGAEVLRVNLDDDSGAGMVSRFYYATKAR